MAASSISLSCPQGGDGTEGDIVSQDAELTAKIIDWVLETGDPEVPKLFKLTGAVTSIAAIVTAVREVLARIPAQEGRRDARQHASRRWPSGPAPRRAGTRASSSA